jgi:pimeloyl-ACP methyl ester carboxylesterase
MNKVEGNRRWVTNDEAMQEAYDALVKKVCPCVVVAHSQGGSFGFNAALTAPDKIRRW